MNRFVPACIMWFALVHVLHGAALTRGPYLQNGTPTSLVIRWRTDTATDTVVRFGPAPNQLTQSIHNASLATEHEITVGGLIPNSLYYYSVGSTGATLAGNDAEHYFITFPVIGTPTRARVWVLGDAGTQNAHQAAVRDAYLNFTSQPSPKHTDLWLMLGDNAYQSGTDDEYQAAVFEMYPTVLRKSVLFSTLGNHDTGQSTAYTDSYPYFNLFTLPSDGEGGGVPSGTEHFYSFDFGNIHFVCLDSMTANRATNGAMANWLRADLANTLSTWIVAFWHHPPYTRGSHNSDFESELIEMRENFNPILEAGGVDLVLAGHSHSYERSFLIDQHYGLSGTFSAANQVDGGSGAGGAAYLKPAGTAAHRGAVYSVAGSSGQISGGLLNHPAMFMSLNVLGSVVLDFATNRLDFRFVDDSGDVRDSFTIVKGDAPPPPTLPLPPTNLAGTSTRRRKIDLTWTQSTSPDVVQNKIYRAGRLAKRFRLLATVPATTNFLSSRLLSRVRYRYQVTAVDSEGR